MSGAHMTLFPAVIQALRARGAGHVVVFGGIVPDEDVEALKQQGVAGDLQARGVDAEIVDWIERELRPRVEGAAA